MESNHLTCPHCGSDNTASVPLVYKRGHATGTATHREIVGYDVETTTTTYSDGSTKTEETGRTAVYGNVTRPTYTVTDLAREIAPPQEPTLSQREHNTMTHGCLAFGCLMPIVAFILEFVAYRISGLAGMGNLLAWLVAALIIWKLWNDRRNTNDANRASKEEYEREMEAYHKKVAAWEKRFICMRCGHIFTP